MMDYVEKESEELRFLPIFIVATVLALEEAIESQLDEIVVGNVFDDIAFGAINLVQPYMTIVNFVSYLICVGGAALIVRAHGSKDKKLMDDLFCHSVSCCLAVGILFCGTYMLFSDLFVSIVAGGSAEYESAGDVFFWQCFYAGLFPLCVFLQTYVLYVGGYVVCGVVTIFCMLLNPYLSVLIGKRIGVGGIMLATVLVNVLEIAILLIYITSKRLVHEFRFYIDFSFLKRIFVLGLGESSIFFSIAIMEFFANSVAISRYGTLGIVAISVVIDLLELVIFVSEGISEYETVALNEYIGRHDSGEIRRTMRICVIASIVEGVAFSCLFAFMSHIILSMFDVDDPHTIEMTTVFIRILIIPPVVICLTRIRAIFYQYTDRIPQTIGVIFMAWGILPAIFCYLMGGYSLQNLVWGLVVGVSIVPVFLTGVKLIRACKNKIV